MSGGPRRSRARKPNGVDFYPRKFRIPTEADVWILVTYDESCDSTHTQCVHLALTHRRDRQGGADVRADGGTCCVGPAYILSSTPDCSVFRQAFQNQVSTSGHLHTAVPRWRTLLRRNRSSDVSPTFQGRPRHPLPIRKVLTLREMMSLTRLTIDASCGA